MTVGFAVPMAGALGAGEEGFSDGAKLALNGVGSIPDAIIYVGGLVPGHDRVFFNGGTFNW
jgi:hypothetical protein